MIDNIINTLKEKGESIKFIIDELRKKNADPKASYRILRFYFPSNEHEIKKEIIAKYLLPDDYNFDNPFLNDFLNSK